MNPDGSITATLADGMNYDAATNSVHLDNYWTNEFTPEHVEFTDGGNVNVALPPETIYHGDNAFTIPEGQVDFINNPGPDYAYYGPDFVTADTSGIHMTMPDVAPEHMEVHPDQGHVSMSTEFATEHFDHMIPEGVEFHPDGSMTTEVPEGTMYDVDSNSLTFAPGQMHMNEIPDGVASTMNSDGSISVTLPPGMEYDAEAGTVHMDNYWANQMTPDPVHVSMDGHFDVNLPPETHYHDGGSFSIPEHQQDFMNNPAPEYVNEGPEWVNENIDGSVQVDVPDHMNLDPAAGTITMDIEHMPEAFGDVMPGNFEFQPDGTLDVNFGQNSADYESFCYKPICRRWDIHSNGHNF